MKIYTVLGCGLLWGIIYFSTNNLNLFAPHELPLMSFEEKIQMNEWWMIPYISWFLYIIIFCLSIKKEAKKFILLASGLVAIHALIFIFYPVEYPRTYNSDSLCTLNKFLLSYDNPRNCLPSLHVSLIFLTLLMAGYLGLSKRIRHLFIAWGTIIMVSVIFVKQHYVIDVLAGIAMATIYFCLFNLNRYLNGKNY